MFKQLWNAFTGKTNKEMEELYVNIRNMLTNIETLKSQNEHLKSVNETITEQLTSLKEQVNKREQKYHSEEPYIEIVSDGFDPEKGIKMNLDWNAAFIEHAKQNGLQGITDYEIVKKYLAHMYITIIEEMGETDTQL